MSMIIIAPLFLPLVLVPVLVLVRVRVLVLVLVILRVLVLVLVRVLVLVIFIPLGLQVLLLPPPALPGRWGIHWTVAGTLLTLANCCSGGHGLKRPAPRRSAQQHLR